MESSFRWLFDSGFGARNELVFLMGHARELEAYFDWAS